ncbi:MAG: hypothetical protein IJK89_07390 [Clostridia bacterium]|nr:hypothetical protein [Clostridia bacterium]
MTEEQDDPVSSPGDRHEELYRQELEHGAELTKMPFLGYQIIPEQKAVRNGEIYRLVPRLYRKSGKIQIVDQQRDADRDGNAVQNDYCLLFLRSDKFRRKRPDAFIQSRHSFLQTWKQKRCPF